MFASTQASVTNDASAKPILPEWAANLWNSVSARFSKTAPASGESTAKPVVNGGKRKSKKSKKSSRKTSRRRASKK